MSSTNTRATELTPTTRRRVSVFALALAGSVLAVACSAEPGSDPANAGAFNELVGPPASSQSCSAACKVVDNCGLLAELGTTHATCVSICESDYNQQQVDWVLAASCTEIAAAVNAIVSCNNACDKLDDCGIFTKYGLDKSQCPSACEGHFTKAQLFWALNASCSDVEQALKDHGFLTAPTPCANVCGKVEKCGLLAKYQITSAECVSFCDNQLSDAEITWALGASCAQIDEKLAAIMPSPCMKLCKKLDGCGLLAPKGVSVEQCASICQSSYTTTQVQAALNLSCAELAKLVGP